ncbi:hypothetical protein SS50377_26612 [Spironucleus salmonicida]|uniref:Uncharacterized protein n=1 Tax=Spironucleus salmonicida TaxID=348837 RepID=A0A9P8RX18_9EUKA|nr:hypothetical protein SS50377_26612 [Spironucleus salmonicida]
MTVKLVQTLSLMELLNKLDHTTGYLQGLQFKLTKIEKFYDCDIKNMHRIMENQDHISTKLIQKILVKKLKVAASTI